MSSRHPRQVNTINTDDDLPTVKLSAHSAQPENAFYADGTLCLKIYGQKTIALLDTGADVSCADYNFLSRAFRGFEGYLKAAPQLSFQTAGNASMKCQGTLELTFMLNTVQCKTTVYVFKNLARPLILGRPFFKRYKAKLDFSSSTLTLNEALPVKTVAAVVVPTGAVVEIAGECVEAGKIQGTDGMRVLVSPDDDLPKECLAVHTVTELGEKSVPLLLKNISTHCMMYLSLVVQ